MKNERGFSLIVLVITIIVLLILTAITLNSSDKIVDDSIDSQKAANAAIDDDKIMEIMTYELAGTLELIDIEIDQKRIELRSGDREIIYDGVPYRDGFALYLAEEDIEKVENKMGTFNYYKPYKNLTKSYIVDYKTGTYIRLEEKWNFKN